MIFSTESVLDLLESAYNLKRLLDLEAHMLFGQREQEILGQTSEGLSAFAWCSNAIRSRAEEK
jgi:hypothetical protein